MYWTGRVNDHTLDHSVPRPQNSFLFNSTCRQNNKHLFKFKKNHLCQSYDRCCRLHQKWNSKLNDLSFCTEDLHTQYHVVLESSTVKCCNCPYVKYIHCITKTFNSTTNLLHTNSRTFKFYQNCTNWPQASLKPIHRHSDKRGMTFITGNSMRTHSEHGDDADQVLEKSF